jgi:hypothetical protein
MIKELLSWDWFQLLSNKRVGTQTCEIIWAFWIKSSICNTDHNCLHSTHLSTYLSVHSCPNIISPKHHGNRCSTRRYVSSCSLSHLHVTITHSYHWVFSNFTASILDSIGKISLIDSGSTTSSQNDTKGSHTSWTRSCSTEHWARYCWSNWSVESSSHVLVIYQDTNPHAVSASTLSQSIVITFFISQNTSEDYSIIKPISMSKFRIGLSTRLYTLLDKELVSN